MSMKHRPWRWTAPVVAAMALVLVVGAAPAWAATGSGGNTTGAQSGTFNYTKAYVIPPPVGPCVYFSSVQYTSMGWTTATAFSDGTNTYSGPLNASMTYSGAANPNGTYSDDLCQTLGPVPVSSATITGSSGGSSVSCSWPPPNSGLTASAGTFQRPDPTVSPTNSNSYQVLLTNGECSVNGGAQSPTNVVWHGVLGTCTPSTGPPTSCPAYDDSYTATN